MAQTDALIQLGAQPPELLRLHAALEEAGETLSALNGRVRADYPQSLAAAWEGEAHDQFALSLAELGRSLSALERAYRALSAQLQGAAAEYEQAEAEALGLAGGG